MFQIPHSHLWSESFSLSLLPERAKLMRDPFLAVQTGLEWDGGVSCSIEDRNPTIYLKTRNIPVPSPIRDSIKTTGATAQD